MCYVFRNRYFVHLLPIYIDNLIVLYLYVFNLQIFRYCSKFQNADSMYKFMDLLINRVDDVELVCCSHMALLGTNLLIKHERLLKKISQRVVDEISQARIKVIIKKKKKTYFNN